LRKGAHQLKRESSLKKSVKSKQLKTGWDNDYLAKVLNAYFSNAFALA
jgi:hypothetical protein